MSYENIASQQKGLFGFIAKHRALWLIIILVIGFALDQASKIWIQRNLAQSYATDEIVVENGEEKTITKEVFYPIRVIEVIPNLFNFSYKENPAAAFSLTRSLPDWFRKPMLICIGIIASVFFLAWYFRMKPADGILLFSFSFILSGAAGNLFDRLRLGYVIDFLDIHLGFIGYHYLHWPTFNIADTLIVIGACGVAYRTLKPLEESSKT